MELLTIQNPENIYNEICTALIPFKEEPLGSKIFVVEGTLENPRIAIKYPGRKLIRRLDLIQIRSNTALWANLLDFEVVYFERGEMRPSTFFAYRNMLDDFEKYKKNSPEFWSMIVELYEHNTITRQAPDLGGLNPTLYLEMLKWMWIQEDVNYKLSWEDVGSPIRYRLQTVRGNVTRNGAGRAKFFGALVLLKDQHFTAEIVKKIVPQS